MKSVIMIISVACCTNILYSQILQGTWSGYFTTNSAVVPDSKSTYVIVFSAKNDTTYEAVSVSYFNNGFKRNDTVSCLVKGWSVNTNQVHLEETVIIKNTFRNISSCLQKMDLSFVQTKKEDRLEGDWWASDTDCGSGKIYLIKQKNK